MSRQIIYTRRVVKIAAWLLLIVFLASLTSCSKQSYQDISPQEAKEMLQNDDQVVLVDVRTKSEYSERHIPGSILIPVGELKKEASVKIKEKDKPIVVYCRTGVRSAKAAGILTDEGYTEVYNLGGISDWPFETVSENDNN